jgi:DNA polymerase III subunit gamma/tau
MTEPTTAYRVLARKYRPTNFAELIGQEVLVKTLTNAIATGRIAHAFILTGVRGIGKTTTARIIARALNCQNGPTITPCDRCDHCLAIAQDRHLDVREIDAASNTGVDNIRELIDGVRYSPSSARYKIYIIDEVHMLSKSAFNALLKTLEEPPPSVKFIFATTEIHKVPVTVLSRCQRFDLKRLDSAELARHLIHIAGLEQSALSPEAAQLLAHAADGSVRDGLSLLDQAMALSDGAEIPAALVQSMLGLVQRGEMLRLLHLILQGEINPALALVQKLYQHAADPLLIAQDLLHQVHLLTRCRLSPDALVEMTTAERATYNSLAEKLSIGNLTRLWQMLLQGIGEIQQASHSLMALEMVLIRIAYAADLPNPAQIAEQLQNAAGIGQIAPIAQPHPPKSAAPIITSAIGGGSNLAIDGAMQTAPATAQHWPDFKAMVDSFAEKGEMLLHHDLYHHVHPVNFAPGKIELRLTDKVRQKNLLGQMASLLQNWGGQRWMIVASQAAGAPTLAEQAQQAKTDLTQKILAEPAIQAVLLAFPSAKVAEIRPRRNHAAEPEEDSTP